MTFPWCVFLTPDQGVAKGAVAAAARWELGTNLSFAFLDGDEDAGGRELQDRIAAIANEWITRTGADLHLIRVKSPEAANIRISFRRKGSWSLLGKYCLGADGNEPTMNFGWLRPGSSERDVRRVVLHEFGHALGFIHEHQNPENEIHWDEPKVIAALSGPPNNWDEAKIRHNVFARYDRRAIIGTPFDPDSIMLYPFPAEWTTDGKSTHANWDLSPKDIDLAKRVYT